MAGGGYTQGPTGSTTLIGGPSPGGVAIGVSNSAGQIGAAGSESGSSLYEISTGGSSTVTSDNSIVANNAASMYEATAAAMEGITVNAGQTAQAAAANPLLERPASRSGSSPWVIIGAITGVGALVYYALKGKI